MGVNLSTASPLPDDVSLENYNGSWRIKNKVLLGTLTYANETTKNLAAIDSSGYDFLVVEGKIRMTGVAAAITMQLNDTNATYSTYIGATSVIRASASTISNPGSRDWNYIRLVIPATSKDDGYLSVRNDGCSLANDFIGVALQYGLVANTQVSKITVASTQGITGTLKIYGVNLGGL